MGQCCGNLEANPNMFLGIDLGTSSVKVALYDPHTGRSAASATWPEVGELPRYSPQPGWAEQDPTDWWNAIVAAIRSLPQEFVSQVQAVGIAYQMHGLVLLDKNGAPVRPAIIWCDDRAVDSGSILAKELTDESRAALLNEPGNFTLAKMHWVREHEPDAFMRVRSAMLPGDYIAFRMTGLTSTTPTGLSEMIGWDFHSRRASNEAWSAVCDLQTRPELAPMIGAFGAVTAEASEATGLPANIPITYRCGDQPNNAYSLGVVSPGTLAAVAGTSGVLYGVSERPIRDSRDRVNTFLHVTDKPTAPRHGVLMCINGAGASYSWLSRQSGKAYQELNHLAESAPPGSEGLSVFPFGNGAERLFGNRSVGGRLENLDTGVHGLTHFSRATLEGVAFTMRYGLDVLRQIGVQVSTIRSGNASLFRSKLFAQIFCDVMGCPVEILDTDGALGAARGALEGFGRTQPGFPVVLDSLEPVHATQYSDFYHRWSKRLQIILAS
ncbi:MAG: hypothetical protein KF812_09540 [Fimbriimonadaceae bacterium]|nr:hypothetical protein [Fimbriimonadaceae bacterium]